MRLDKGEVIATGEFYLHLVVTQADMLPIKLTLLDHLMLALSDIPGATISEQLYAAALIAQRIEEAHPPKYEIPKYPLTYPLPKGVPE